MSCRCLIKSCKALRRLLPAAATKLLHAISTSRNLLTCQRGSGLSLQSIIGATEILRSKLFIARQFLEVCRCSQGLQRAHSATSGAGADNHSQGFSRNAMTLPCRSVLERNNSRGQKGHDLLAPSDCLALASVKREVTSASCERACSLELRLRSLLADWSCWSTHAPL